MKIKSQNEFIDLFLIALAESGFLISSFQLPDDFISIMSNRKYSEFFSFFQNLSDLDFVPRLKILSCEGYIDFKQQGNKNGIIDIRKLISHPNSFMEHFNQDSIHKMQELIDEVNSTHQLNDMLKKEGATGTYRKDNSNGIYSLDEGDKIFTNGNLIEMMPNTYMVENSSFCIVESFKEQRLQHMQVTYPFEFEYYMKNVITNILELHRMQEDSSEQQRRKY